MITVRVRDDLAQSVLRMSLRNRLPADIVIDDGSIVRAVVMAIRYEEAVQSGGLMGIVTRWIAEVEPITMYEVEKIHGVWWVGYRHPDGRFDKVAPFRMYEAAARSAAKMNAAMHKPVPK